MHACQTIMPTLKADVPYRYGPRSTLHCSRTTTYRCSLREKADCFLELSKTLVALGANNEGPSVVL